MHNCLSQSQPCFDWEASVVNTQGYSCILSGFIFCRIYGKIDSAYFIPIIQKD